MRTLQEKYNGVNEGAFSKDQFLRDARLQLPNLVTRFNGYDDAVQILKNRGMIQEDQNMDKLMKLADEIELKDLVQGLAADAKRGLMKLATKGKEALGKGLLSLGHITQDELDQKLGKKPVNEATQPKPTKKGLADYRYKATNDMDKYPYEQILRGLRVELEGLGVAGTPTPEEYTKALAKVLKNLEKDGIFYTNQIAGIKANKKRTDLMIDATPKTVVDKENGLQKAALKEAIKSVIKNILKEDDSSVSGLYDDEDQYKMYPGDQDVYGAEEVDEELWDLFSPYIHDDSDIEDQMTAYKEGGFSALSKELQDHLKDDERFKNWTSTYGRSEVEGDEDDEEFSRDLPFEGVDEVATDITGFPKWRELSQDEKDHIAKSVKDSGDRDQAAYEKRREERLKAQSQRLEKHIRGGKENEGIGLSPEIFESVSLMDILDEGSSKHSTEWHKGYKAFNDDKKLSSNPYKENPQKKDWAAGWDKAQSDESDSYKGY